MVISKLTVEYCCMTACSTELCNNYPRYVMPLFFNALAEVYVRFASPKGVTYFKDQYDELYYYILLSAQIQCQYRFS